MWNEVKLIGLDFGTTTSSAVAATALLARNAATGRGELAQVRECFRSEMVFTPMTQGDRLHEGRITEQLDSWLQASGVRPDEVFGGGALLTGLTAQKENAAALVKVIRNRLGNALIASADDPCLESWLAFMGSCAELSQAHPEKFILNLDIGGGTTNLALGKAGEVLRTGCLFVGARHVQVHPGTYRITKLSRYAVALFDHLDIRKAVGDCVTDTDVTTILDFYISLLESVVAGTAELSEGSIVRLHTQVPFRLPADVKGVCITCSGGVGELIYGRLQGKPWPPTTHYGDLGIDLARRIADSPAWLEHLREYRPASAGRATVYGLLRHCTTLSGSTLFLPRPQVLPLADVPILGSISSASSETQVYDLLTLVRRSARGGCVRVSVEAHEADAVRTLGGKIAQGLRAVFFPENLPLVLLMRANLGKVLGEYITEWGALPLNIVVIDEVAVRDAHYVQLGPMRDQVVPISFYGLNEPGDSP